MGITLAHLKEAVDRLLDRIALVAQTASKSIEEMEKTKADKVNIMSLTTPKLMAERRLTAPTPHDGAGLDVCGGHGDAGKGGKQQVCGARQVGGEALILFELDHALADDLMMRSPPTLVPIPIVAEHSSIIQMGEPASPTLVWPLAKATPKRARR